MVRTLIALVVLLGLAGTALAAPPAVSPPGRKAGPAQEPTPGPVGKERQPDSWTWFGMGFESRRARLGAQDDFPAWTEDDAPALVNRAAGYAGTSQANQSVLRTGSPGSPAPAAAIGGPSSGSSLGAPIGAGGGGTPFGGGTVVPLNPGAAGTSGASFGGGSTAPAAPAMPAAGGSSFGSGSPVPNAPTAPPSSGTSFGSPGASIGSPGGSPAAVPAAGGGRGR